MSFQGSGYENQPTPVPSKQIGPGFSDNLTAKVVSHIPDLVVTADQRKTLPYQVAQQGVLMFLDISGNCDFKRKC